jgi:hypothetical protein
MSSDFRAMSASPVAGSDPPRENLFTASDVESILVERGWLDSSAEVVPLTQEWVALAATYLGPQAADRAELADLLSLFFHYDAAQILAQSASHAVLARAGARDVIRELAREIIGGAAVDSERFKAIIESLRPKVSSRSRHLFHPIRLALAGRAGEGELDRVILLLDSAAVAPGLAPVRNNSQRMLEFCAALH